MSAGFKLRKARDHFNNETSKTISECMESGAVIHINYLNDLE